MCHSLAHCPPPLLFIVLGCVALCHIQDRSRWGEYGGLSSRSEEYGGLSSRWEEYGGLSRWLSTGNGAKPADYNYRQSQTEKTFPVG